MNDRPEPETELHYARYLEGFRLRIARMSSHELRTVLIGLWLRLDPPDRIDHVRELQHYLTAGSTPPELSRSIADEGGLLS